MSALKDRPTVGSEVVSEPTVMGGDPVVRGTRIRAETILSYLRAGDSPGDVQRLSGSAGGRHRSCRPPRLGDLWRRLATLMRRNVSQLARASRTVLGEGLFRKLVQLASASIAFDRCVESRGVIARRGQAACGDGPTVLRPERKSPTSRSGSLLASLPARRFPFWLRIERCAIEFPLVGIGDAHGASPRFQFGLDLRQLASELLRLVGGNVEILKDDRPLIPEFILGHKIE
jgi:hypothetical protein